jgi:hypothetical protein
MNILKNILNWWHLLEWGIWSLCCRQYFLNVSSHSLGEGQHVTGIVICGAQPASLLRVMCTGETCSPKGLGLFLSHSSSLWTARLVWWWWESKCWVTHPPSLPLHSSSHNFQSCFSVTDVKPSQHFLFKNCIIEFSGDRIVLWTRRSLKHWNTTTLQFMKDLVC